MTLPAPVSPHYWEDEKPRCKVILRTCRGPITDGDTSESAHDNLRGELACQALPHPLGRTS
jgi:hypothetical protein